MCLPKAITTLNINKALTFAIRPHQGNLLSVEKFVIRIDL